MADKLPSYIEFTPQTDDNCAAYDDSGGGDGCDLTSYTDDSSTENGDFNACDYANWRGGGEDTTRDVSCEDIDAMKRMVHDMLRNPELLHMSPLYSEIVGGVASSTQDGSMTGASCVTAAVSHASPSLSFPMECDKEDLEAMKRMVHDMLRNPELLHVSPFYSEIVGVVSSSSSSTQDGIMTVASFGVAAVSHASPSSSPVKCEATFMPVTPTTATKTTIAMSPYLCQEYNCSVPPPLPVRTSPTRTVTMPWAPPLPFR
jgi:hypothetical protein